MQQNRITTEKPSPVSVEYEEIRIENTNHCGYKCFFCPRDELTRDTGYMSVEDLDTVLQKIWDYDGSVDLHGFGEPLLDTELPRKIALVKSRWPNARTRIISTLGLSLKREAFEDLAASGLDMIEVSFYGVDTESYKSAHGVNKFTLAKSNLETLANIVREQQSEMEIVVREFPVHDTIVPAINRQEMDKWLLDIGVVRSGKHRMHNYGSGRQYNTPETEGTCSVVWGFRKRVLQITWDLDVIPCCFDSNSTVVFGNLRTQTLDEVFSGDFYNRFIQAHKENKLDDYPVCVNCERCFKP